MSRLLRGSLLLAAVAALLLPSGRAQTAKGKKHALLIGVGYYKNGGYEILRGTENDVEELAKVLARPAAGFSVRLLTTARGKKNPADAPTAANIRKELDKLLQGRERDETVLIALAGHGADIEVDDPEKDEKKRKPANTYTYFFPTDVDDLENISHSTGHSAHLIEIGDLFKRLAAPKCGAGTKLVLIDACRENFSATSSVRTMRGLSPTRATVPDGVSALFSCGPGEAALETGFPVGAEERTIHGVFFWHVIEGLKGAAARDGAVSWPGLTEYVQKKVPAFVEKKKIKVRGKLLEQTPHAISNARRLTLLVEAVEAADDGGKKPAKEEVVKDAKEFTNAIGMRLVRIPADKFTMGSPKEEQDRALRELTEEDRKKWEYLYRSEGPQHEVEVSAFYMGVHEVTVGQFRAFVKDTGYRTEAETGDGAYRWTGDEWKKDAKTNWKNPGFEQDEDHPVTCVSWNDARAFCDWLNKSDEKKPSGHVYRLPTEAEWEYSCRGPGTFPYQPFHFGDSLSSRQANFDGNYPFGGAAKGDYKARTTKVGSYEKNRFGLHDMHGNVWEWCADWYGEKYYAASPKRDPAGPSEGSSRVLRGGSWCSTGRFCRSASRDWDAPGYRYAYAGFRVAVVPSSRGKMPE